MKTERRPRRQETQRYGEIGLRVIQRSNSMWVLVDIIVSGMSHTECCHKKVWELNEAKEKTGVLI